MDIRDRHPSYEETECTDPKTADEVDKVQFVSTLMQQEDSLRMIENAA